ncbi:MAG: circularly permuted type 2 ATP-grasp protein [Verrucomicrobiota bacterium]
MQGVSTEPAPSSSEGGASLAPYAPLKARRDEAMDDLGEIRPGWYEVFESVGRHGLEVLGTWRKETARISRERGLAYRPERIDSSDRSGNWSLDPIPWVIEEQQWAPIEAGIAQRVRLYEALLADLYGGPQKVFSEKLLPPEIVFAHPGYVRAAYDMTPSSARVGLGMVATDLAHDGSGKLFALNDRFDRPFGLGLALENRTIVNTVLPNLFRRNRVKRIGHFFVEWFDHLANCSPTHTDRARVAILDSTPEDEESEISFLANYCGVLRAIPSDLTVRDGQVWLKTVAGLEPIDVIWKFTAGRELDPLETGEGLGRGVPGMFEAIRQGNVAVASHPGAEVLQSPGLFPFLSRVCEALLGESLIIPPVATWWCGAPNPRSLVLENLSTMVVKSAGPHRDFRTHYGSRMSDAELYELKARIEAHPERFVAQEELMLTTVPASSPEGLTPRGAVLRAFSFPDREGNPKVMPGGLARVSTEEGVVVSTRTGGDSKDVWIRSSNEDVLVDIATEVRRSRFISPETVTSHAAENLFWVGRNAERSDFVTRFMTRILEGRVLGFFHNPEQEAEHEAVLVDALFSLFECKGWLGRIADPDGRLMMILRDKSCPASIGYHIANFSRTTDATREQWSPAATMAIESVCDGWIDTTRGMRSLYRFQSPLESLQLNLAAFLGMNLDSMTRDRGWAMLDAGRRIERGVNITKLLAYLLRNQVSEPVSNLLNESVLFISDSLGTYQSTNFSEPKLGAMLNLLLGERDYPRSVKFLYERLEQVLGILPAPMGRSHPAELISERKQHLDAFCEKLDRDQEDPDAIRSYASDDLQILMDDLRELSDHLTKSYFSHARKDGI